MPELTLGEKYWYQYKDGHHTLMGDEHPPDSLAQIHQWCLGILGSQIQQVDLGSFDIEGVGVAKVNEVGRILGDYESFPAISYKIAAGVLGHNKIASIEFTCEEYNIEDGVAHVISEYSLGFHTPPGIAQSDWMSTSAGESLIVMGEAEPEPPDDDGAIKRTSGGGYPDYFDYLEIELPSGKGILLTTVSEDDWTEGGEPPEWLMDIARKLAGDDA
jgi:hypothetical protein